MPPAQIIGKVTPAVQCTVLPAGPEAISLNPSKIMSVKKLKSALGGVEDCVRMCHGLNLLSFQWIVGNSTYITKGHILALGLQT